MKLRIKEIGIDKLDEIELPDVPRCGDSFKLSDGTFVIAGNTYWEIDNPPIVTYRRLEP